MEKGTQKNKNIIDNPRGTGMLESSNIIALAAADINKRGNNKQ